MTRKVCLAVWCLMPFLSAYGADFYPDLKVVSATVYTEHADVLREGTVDIREAGVHRLWLNQPLSGGKGGGEVLVSGAQVRSRILQPNEQAPISNQAERVTAARMRVENTRRALNDNERQAAAWAKRLELADSKTNDVKTMLAQLAEEYKLLMHRHMEAEYALNKAQAMHDWEGGSGALPVAVVLDVVVDKPGKVSIAWREQTDLVSWKPAMQLALDTRTQQISWQAEAVVSQKSGLDFDNITLRLGLSAPRDVLKPPFQPITLRLGERHNLQERVMAAMDFPAFARTRPANEGVPAHAAVKDIQLPGLYSLPSGNNQMTVSYLHGSAKADVYRAVYSWEKPQAAIVMAEFTLPDVMSFVPGKVQVYRDGSLVAERDMDEPWHGGARFDTSFGEDVSVKVTQQNPGGYQEDKTAGTLEYQSDIVVNNQSSAEQWVRVYAMLPVAGEKDIQVKPIWPQIPESNAADGVKGIVFWQKNLHGGESWTLRHGYSVSYPQGKQIIGL